MVTAATEPVLAGDRRAARLPSLTGLRFAAAALVFVSHAPTLHVFANEHYDDLFARYAEQAGVSAVEFFFVLSGFVLTWSARPSDTARSFWLRRAAKIYPNNIVACLLAMLGLVATGHAVPAGIALANVFLVQDWAPNVPLSAGLNLPSWSLGCEVLFYLAFPLLLPLIRRAGDRLLWPLAGAVVALIALLPLIASLLPGGPDYQGGLSFTQYWFLYVFPVSRLLDFVLGIVLAQLVSAGRCRIGFGVALLIAAVVFALTEFAPLRYALVATMIVPLALVIAAAARADVRGSRSFVRGRIAVWLGEVSFAFYLLHDLVLRYGHLIVRQHRWDWPAGIAVLLAFFVVSLALSAALYLTVERPIVRAVARSLRTRSASGARSDS